MRLLSAPDDAAAWAPTGGSSDGPADALNCRFVLMHQTDPARTLREAPRHVRSALEALGAHPNMGLRLRRSPPPPGPG